MRVPVSIISKLIGGKKRERKKKIFSKKFSSQERKVVMEIQKKWNRYHKNKLVEMNPYISVNKLNAVVLSVPIKRQIL